MNEEKINKLIKNKQIISKTYSKEQVISLVNSVNENIKITLQIPLTEHSSTVVFREIYESLRQIGDALWWLEGFEPQHHDVSIEIIKTLDCLSPEQKVKLHSLDRFKKIRHDANYRGFKVLLSQAQEIVEFWGFIGKVIVVKIGK